MTGQQGDPAGVFGGRSSAGRFIVPVALLTVGLVAYLVVVVGRPLLGCVAGVVVLLVAVLARLDGRMLEWWHRNDAAEETLQELAAVKRAAAEAEAHIDSQRRRIAELTGVDPDFDKTQVAE